MRVVTVRDLMQQEQMGLENRALRLSSSDRDRCGDVVRRSPLMQKACERLSNVAASAETVVICGETGTGKEPAAHTIFE